MKPLREKVHNKLFSMASILLDNVIVPEEIAQEGADSITASYYDDDGNKYTFTLSLTVMPEIKVDLGEEPPMTLADQINLMLEKMTGLEEDVALLKGYHNEQITDDTPNETEPNTEG